MYLFINEESIHGQYNSNDEYEKAMLNYKSVLSRIRDIKGILGSRYMRVFIGKSSIGQRKAIKNQRWYSCLDCLPNRDLRRALDSFKDKQLPENWEKNRKHLSMNDYYCNSDRVTDTGMAELLECMMLNASLQGALFNFVQSKYTSEASLPITKNGITKSINCFENKSTLDTILNINRLIYEFKTSTTAPSDRQTVLRDGSKFRKLAHTENGRYVYKELSSGKYWYVDSGHSGKIAHLEVFNSDCTHFGEANIMGNIDITKRDPRKRLIL